MLWWTLHALAGVSADEVTVVINPELSPDTIGAIALDAGVRAAACVVQEPQLGTGHAVSVALASFAPAESTVVILSADMPSIEAELVRRVINARTGAAAMATAKMPLPSNFGRVIRKDGEVERIVEVRDAAADELAVDEMNAALYAFDEAKLRRAIAELGTDNAQGEYYLTDAVGALRAGGERVAGVLVPDHRSVLGVNDRVELASARAHINLAICERHMRNGVTIVDPSTTYLEPGLEIGADAVILPNTAIGRGSVIGAGSEIGPNSRLANARVGRHAIVAESVVIDSEIGDFCTVGPFAHVRGNSVLQTGVRIGNFVETKNVVLAPGVKASHLTYLGDAAIGKNTNIGAGTITANFDGRAKHRTEIGENVAIGTNSSLVAPLVIGDGALTGAGSVVTRDVPPGERVAGNPARPLPKKQVHT